MKLSITLSLLLGMATLFQGCSSTDETAQAKSTTITGSTTLASGLRAENKSTVCLDLNDNLVCDTDEPAANTDIAGKYSLNVEGTVADGTMLLTYGGIDLLPLTDTNQTLKFYKHYVAAEGTQNINIVSTLIVDNMAQNPDSSYADVKANIANNYSIDPDQIDGDPLTLKGDFLNRVIGLQALSYDQNVSAQPSSAYRAADQSADTAPDAGALNTFVTDNAGLLDDYLTLLNEYLDAISAWYDSLWEENAVVEEEIIVPPTVIEVLPVKRADLNGAWYIIDASGDKTCSLIDSSDNIQVTEADGTVTDLSLTFSKNGDVITAMTLKLGFFTADTINFAEYRSDKTFDGSYTSDGETLGGIKMSSYTTCKSEKLGL